MICDADPDAGGGLTAAGDASPGTSRSQRVPDLGGGVVAGGLAARGGGGARSIAVAAARAAALLAVAGGLTAAGADDAGGGVGLSGEQRPTGFPVDAAGEPGDEGFRRSRR